jgi:hypothetical protein
VPALFAITFPSFIPGACTPDQCQINTYCDQSCDCPTLYNFPVTDKSCFYELLGITFTCSGCPQS